MIVDVVDEWINNLIIQDEDKFCPKCKITKPKIEFNNHKQTRDGLYTYCRDCGKLQAKESDLKEYGLTFETYNALVQSQNYRCKICTKQLDLGPNTVVDHCHRTNRMRGILCRGCNGKLAWYENYTANIVKHLGV